MMWDENPWKDDDFSYRRPQKTEFCILGTAEEYADKIAERVTEHAQQSLSFAATAAAMGIDTSDVRRMCQPDLSRWETYRDCYSRWLPLFAAEEMREEYNLPASGVQKVVFDLRVCEGDLYTQTVSFGYRTTDGKATLLLTVRQGRSRYRPLTVVTAKYNGRYCVELRSTEQVNGVHTVTLLVPTKSPKEFVLEKAWNVRLGR